jgi:allantoicase
MRAGTDVVGAHAVTAPATVASETAEVAMTEKTASAPATALRGPMLPVLPLTAEAFAPFGKVVQAYADPHGAPRGTKITSANQGSAHKFHKLSLLEASYPEDSGATVGLSIFRCAPLAAQPGQMWDIKLLERHPYTNQAFIPMSGDPRGKSEDALEHHGSAYLVVVALNGQDDKPDLSTMRAFIANGGQGVVYSTGIWREFAFPSPTSCR